MKRFHSQLRRANLGVRGPIRDVQLGAATGGHVAFHKNEGWRNPSKLCQLILGTIQ